MWGRVTAATLLILFGFYNIANAGAGGNWPIFDVIVGGLGAIILALFLLRKGMDDRAHVRGNDTDAPRLSERPTVLIPEGPGARDITSSARSERSDRYFAARDDIKSRLSATEVNPLDWVALGVPSHTIDAYAASAEGEKVRQLENWASEIRSRRATAQPPRQRGSENASPHVLRAHRNQRSLDLGHSIADNCRPSSRYSQSQGKWPYVTTSVPPSSTLVDFGSLASPETGLLRQLGYRVGKSSGLTETARRQILDQVLAIELRAPPGQERYLAQWGRPNSRGRLTKMANCLAAFIRLRKRDESRDNAVAIRHWEEDLLYLQTKYGIRRL